MKTSNPAFLGSLAAGTGAITNMLDFIDAFMLKLHAYNTNKGNLMFMAYDEPHKKATLKYIKEKQVRTEICWLRHDFETYIKPAIESTGKPAGTFIKEAVIEKIKRDGLGEG